MVKKLLLAVVTGLFGFGTVHAASFDCARASTHVEKLVCSTPGLSVLDERLARSYAIARKSAENSTAVVHAQRTWLSDVRNKCGDTTCLLNAYDQRITELDLLASAGMAPAAYLHYVNAKFGFELSLPASWKGYAINNGAWHGDGISDPKLKVSGPLISILHPGSTTEHPYQPIPIMVFTLSQWDQVQQESLAVGNAPIPPSELARNSLYVFALPARYNFADLEGRQEVEAIMEAHPVKAMPPQDHGADSAGAPFSCVSLADDKADGAQQLKKEVIRKAYADAGEMEKNEEDDFHAYFVDDFCVSDEHDKARNYYDYVVEGLVSERFATAVAKLVGKHYEPLPRGADGKFLITCKFANRFDAPWPTRYVIHEVLGESSNRYDDLFVGHLCDGYYHEADKLIDYGYVSAKNARALAARLQVDYAPNAQTEFGKRLVSLKDALHKRELYGVLEGNAAYIAAEMPTSECGVLVDRAIKGDHQAADQLQHDGCPYPEAACEQAYKNQDDAHAVQACTAAANLGGSNASAYLGDIYLAGRGVDRDPAKGVQWVRRAAERGNELGELDLGIAYLRGDGVTQNPREAEKWLLMAAEQGSDAQLILAKLYLDKKGPFYNSAAGMKWLRRAADHGDDSAQQLMNQLNKK